jgi:predicted DNA-binding transcriptional regulator AlpA
LRKVADHNLSDNFTIIRRKALAQALGVSTVTLWRMRDELPPQVQISKGISGWRQSDIHAWIEKRSTR